MEKRFGNLVSSQRNQNIVLNLFFSWHLQTQSQIDIQPHTHTHVCPNVYSAAVPVSSPISGKAKYC